MKNIQEVLREGSTSAENAAAIFDSLEPVDVAFMLGVWQGSEVHTNHPMNGLLESSGWYGKTFIDAENVNPLVFYTADKSGTFAADPIKLGQSSQNGTLNGNQVAAFKDQVETTETKARLRMTEYRGKVSATMIYDDQPINDVFRKIDEDTVLGAMDAKGDPGIYFFALRRIK